ncbi:MAG: hypothetical protein CMJ90_15635 [Planctomycetes bacterium]|nr:hypothetical protein [Planctomycetota bacterium]
MSNNRYGLGYWISEEHSGRGCMTELVRKVILLAKDEFCATEIWPGITANNPSSINLVMRLGFKLARRQEMHLSYQLKIVAEGIGA